MYNDNEWKAVSINNQLCIKITSDLLLLKFNLILAGSVDFMFIIITTHSSDAKDKIV